MASAVLPGREYWNDLDPYLKQFTGTPHCQVRFKPSGTQNTVRNRSFSHTGRVSDPAAETAPLQGNVPLMRRPPVAIDDLSFANRKEVPVQSKDSFRREHVTYHLSSYSKSELKELRMRLISDLERVRAVLTWVENWELESRRGFPRPQVNLPPAGETNQKPAFNGRPPLGIAGNKNNHHKIGGQKRALASVDGRETKRRMGAAIKAKASGTMINKCKSILTTLMNQRRYGYMFDKPVDVEGLKLYDYYEVIQHPMDLGTIKRRLDKCVYKSPFDFAADVRLTFGNAMNYNPVGSLVYKAAESMLSSFEKMFQQFQAQKQKAVAPKMNQNASRVRQKSLIMMPEEEGKLAVIPVSKNGKLPKPKAKDPNKRKMTAEEKGELRFHLERMPPEKMEQMLPILLKRNSKLKAEGNEFEVDIDDLDSETLWELDRFVSNHQKKEMIRMRTPQFRYDAIKLIQEDLKPESLDGDPHRGLALENERKGDGGEEYVDIGEDNPNEFPPVEIERDPVGSNPGSSSSSSSSSSGDSSSSSDSDAGSTSDSDSDDQNVQSPATKLY